MVLWLLWYFMGVVGWGGCCGVLYGRVWCGVKWVLWGGVVREVLQLADTLWPLAMLLGLYSMLLTCSLPWSHLQVAVVPDGCMLTPWQVGMYVCCAHTSNDGLCC
jgi:hypothetical protein